MTDKLYWYNVLLSCYGYRFTTEDEQRTFYEIILEETGAKNSEICEAIKAASSKGIKSKEQYGRVSTADVVNWVRLNRERPSESTGSPFVSQFIESWRAELAVHPGRREEMETACYSIGNSLSFKQRQEIIEQIVN